MVFNCPEEKRITEPILQKPPIHLYYFTAYIKSTGQKDEHMDFFNKNVEVLQRELPNLEIIQKEIDYTDYLEVIQEISKIVKEEREKNPDCEICINLGSGSKMTALASAEASSLWNCSPYYVHSTYYNPQPAGPRHEGEIIVKTPVLFPLIKPDEELIMILKIIDNLMEEKYSVAEYEYERRFIYKKELLDYLIDNRIIELDRINPDDRKTRSSYYMKMKSKYLDKLENLNYIEIEREKRSQKIYLTNKGEDVVKIFKYLI
ncbi:MAG: HFX_2341 family transcriptional regulator domain-containing protein [Promethearchaeota archaeon]